MTKYLISLYRRILGKDLSDHWKNGVELPEFTVGTDPELKPRIKFKIKGKN